MKIETSCQISRTNTHCDPGGFPDVNLNVIVNDLFGQLDSEAQSGPMTFDRPPAQQCIQSQDFPRASVSDYVADLFTTEDHLVDALSLIGPTVTWFAITPKVIQYGGGVFYEPDECVNYAFEEIPAECVVERAGRTTYTCTVNNGVNCGDLLPDHCQLYLAGGPQYHAVAVVGYGEVCLGTF